MYSSSTRSNLLVSVIIPTYKRSDYLERAIDSVLAQTYKNIEIVVVDDNAPGSIYRKTTNAKMDQYAQNKNIKYIQNEKNLGGALARNQGIMSSMGDYITFLDDDDVYLPNKVYDQLEYMLRDNLELSFSNVDIKNEFNKIIDHREHSYIDSLENNELLKYHLMHHLTPTSTYMYKRSSILSIDGFDDAKVGQEFRLMLKSIEYNLKIGYLNKTNVVQYAHSGERISIGKNKIYGERLLFDLKKEYFNLLNESEIKYIRFRYYAVLSIVGIRSKMYGVFINNLMRSFITSPRYFFNEGYNLIKTRTSKEVRS